MVWSPIQPKKQDNKKNSVVRWQGRGKWGNKIWKKGGGGRQYRSLHKMGGGGGLASLCQLCKETLKISHLPIVNKTTLHIPGFPPFLVKIPHPSYYSHFWKISSPPLYEGGRGVQNMRCHLTVLWMLNLLLKDFFLAIFCIFFILLQIIHRMSNINNFLLLLIQESLLKTYTTMYSDFSTSTFVKLFLFINFYFLGVIS